MVGTRRRMPNEITEVLMVKEPLVDLARVVIWGVFMEVQGDTDT